MTYEKALMILHGLRMSYICDPNECQLEEKDENHILCKGCDEHHEALVMAIKALEKQMPKKPRIIEEERQVDVDKWALFDICHCPICGNEMEYMNEWEFCWKCGQAIDWSDEE